MYKCDNCKYARFEYDTRYKLQYVYCKKVKDKLKKSAYRNLKNCLFHKEL